MAFAPYTMLFTDQNPNREFIIQPLTANGPGTPNTGVDPTATTANTTLFLYGQGHPNYGERIQEDMVYMLENFFSLIEPSFPIPGQLWCKSSLNEIANPFQLFVYNPRKYKITNTTTNAIYVQSDDGSETAATILARYQALGLAKSFNVYDANYDSFAFIQAAVPTIVGSSVQLTVTPATPVGGLTGQFTGGWEEVYQGNATVVLRRAMSAGGYQINNLADPTVAQDAATKNYVDLAVGGGTLTLAGLADVALSGPTPGQFLTYNGTKWTNTSPGASLYLPITGGTMQGVIDMGGFILTDLPLPTTPYDAASKLYVDQQPLSRANTSITTPATGDILIYNGTLWQNQSAINSGFVPISGGVTMTGPLSMGNQALTGLVTPVNPTDAANKSYVDSAISTGGVLTSGVYNPVSGVLTLVNSGSFPPVIVTGFSPASYSIPVPSTSTNQFFALEYGQTSPTTTTVSQALNQVDAALGAFVVPRQQLVFATPGSRTAFDLNKLAFATPALPPGRQFVKGSHNLAVYLNGIKQVASTSGVARITSSTIRDDFDISFPGGSCNVGVNGASPVVVTIATQPTLGAVRDAINAVALSHYVNAITGVSGLQFQVNGDMHTAFTSGTQFTVKYSGTSNDTSLFTVAANATYASGVTTIPVTTLPIATAAGAIFQNNWGFAASIENGQFVFHSNIPGSASAITVTDTNLFNQITGGTYPITGFASIVTTGNSLPPTDYGYAEIGMYGYQSSLIDLTSAPVLADFIEVIIDREMVYTSTNPLAAATIG